MRLDASKATLREPADVSAWLLTLKKVLRLPEGEAAAILDELEDHLRQRVRDLELSGLGDAEAVRLALNELGDAAVLARRFRSASSYKRRRLAMNVAVIGMACGAAVLSAISVARGPQQAANPRQGLAPAANAYTDAAAQQPGPGLTFTEAKGQQLGEILGAVAKALGVSLHAHWGRLEGWGVRPDLTVVVVGRDLDIVEVFRRINEDEGLDHGTLDYRVGHGVLEVAEREFFDRRERVLATYDIARLLERATGPEHRTQLVESLTGALTRFVSPEDWQDNGGELGVLSVVDTKLFIEAPPRMHRQVVWILDQLDAEGKRAAADEARRDREALRLELDAIETSALRMRAHLGLPLTDDERQRLKPFMAEGVPVTVLGQDDPHRPAVESQLATYEKEIARLRKLLEPGPSERGGAPLLRDIPLLDTALRR